MLTFKKGLFTLLALMALHAQAKVVTEAVTYQVDGKDFSGFIAYDNTKGKRPGVLIVHEWWGHNDFARHRAEALAKEGYTALALDMYGKGNIADHPDNAKTFMMAVFDNMPAAEKRFNTAYDLLNNHKMTKKGQIAAMGYCFGGAIALHMARIGSDLDAVISFHGNLSSNLKAGQSPQIKAKVMAFTGGADPFAPKEQVIAFADEMFSANVDFDLQVYKDVKHSFTNPGADAVGEKFKMPLQYNRPAAEDSWARSMDLLNRVFND
ncbi:MAG: dienelactone hydrolase family protein [Pseudomonadales bacterium]|nr:dienelactone hydrolase family protein [Pseudomonadales bacterium]